MAIVFALVADFGDNRQLAEEYCRWLNSRTSPVDIDRHTISLHGPLISAYSNPTRFKVSVAPENVGYNVALDDDYSHFSLNGEQLSQLGNALYDLLRDAPNYELAMVGWDVDFLLNFSELSAEWAAEIRNGSFKGLVVDTSLLTRLPKTSHFVPFDENHCWIPYAGSDPLDGD